MHFLQSLQAAAPLQLRPDRPAVTHQLSLDQLRLDQASSQLQQRKQREQLTQIDRLSEIIREKDRQLAEQEGRQLQRQLLFQIEVDRLRRILSEWDGERRKHADDSRAKQNLYRARFQEIKTTLSAQFTQRVDQIRAETKNDLQRIKELYDIRVAKLQEEGMKEEHRMRLAQMEVGNQQGRLQLSEAERQKLQATILLRESRIAELEEQLHELQQERRKLKDDNERLVQDKARQLEYLRLQQESKEGEYDAARTLVIQLQTTIEQLRIDKEQWNDAKRRAGDRVAALEIRCESLQQEVEQFRSRKTQHAFVRQASQNTLSHQQSERQQLSLSPGLKDSRSLPLSRPRRQEAGITDIEEEYERKRVGELQEELRLLQAELDSQKEQLSQKVAIEERNEEALRQADRELDTLKKSFEERERELAKLKAEVLQLEAKMKQREQTIGRLQADMERNDGGKAERVWLERIARAEQALQTLGTEWTKRERQLAGLFKKIQSTYRAQIQKGQEVEKRLKKENEQMQVLLMEKIKQLSVK